MGMKPIRAKGDLFLRGPIPLRWLEACSEMGGKTIMAAIALWWQAGMNGTTKGVKLTTAGLRRFKVDRKAKERALVQLEAAGLIEVERRIGANPLITILIPELPADEWAGLTDAESVAKYNEILNHERK